MITEKIFLIVSVLNESIEMMLKCLRNRGVISFLPPPGGPMADTSNWSTSVSIEVSFLAKMKKPRAQNGHYNALRPLNRGDNYTDYMRVLPAATRRSVPLLRPRPKVEVILVCLPVKPVS